MTRVRPVASGTRVVADAVVATTPNMRADVDKATASPLAAGFFKKSS
jgi:hypothetical protein